MVKPKQFEIIFGNPHKAYKAGTTVTGSLILHVDEPQRYTSLHLLFSGKATVGFSKSTGGKRRQHYHAKERYLKREICLLPREGGGESSNATVAEGHHEFPFSFNLPASIPSSFECKSGGVRYCVKARLKMGWNNSVSIKRHFVVFHPLDLNDHDSARYPVEREVEKTFCFASGSLSACFSIPKQGFVPGETIPVVTEVLNNTSSAVREMYFTILEVSHCHAIGRTDTNLKTILPKTPLTKNSEIAAGASVTWTVQDSIVVPVAVPTGLDGCHIIDIEHRLILNVVPRGFACTLEASVNIMIGTVPLVNDQYSTHNVASSLSICDSGYSNSQADCAIDLPATSVNTSLLGPILMQNDFDSLMRRGLGVPYTEIIGEQPPGYYDHADSQVQQETPM